MNPGIDVLRTRSQLYKDRNWLRQEYVEQKHSLSDIARELGCGVTTVRRYMEQFQIPRRDLSNAIRLATGNTLTPSPRLLQIIYGELLSDGNIAVNKKNIEISSARYQHSSKYKEYLDWLKSVFENEGLKCGNPIKVRHSVKSFSVRDGYHLKSKSYPFLLAIYKEFYKNGKKIVPRNISLSSLAWRHLYIGDGSLSRNSKSNPFIRFSTECFQPAEVRYLCDLLNQEGILATTYRRRDSLNIRISAYDTAKFLDWIGPCPIDCYAYKWNNNPGKGGNHGSSI